VLADLPRSFQCNGITFGLRFGVRNGTPVLLVEEGWAALVASLKSLQRTVLMARVADEDAVGVAGHLRRDEGVLLFAHDGPKGP